MTRVELAGIFIGVTLLVLGAVAVIAARLRLRRGSATLVTFGLWCGLYGARLLASQPVVRATVGGDPHHWSRFVAFVTYTINVPITFFVQSLVGPGWRRSVRWLIATVVSVGVVAIATDLIVGPGTADKANSWLVLVATTVGLANIVYASVVRGVRTPLTDPVVAVGGIVLLLFVINENVGEIVLPRLDIEPIGVLVFILCLGYAVSRSAFRAEADFVGVQRELETARQIQSSLLPRQVPRPAGLDVAVRYVPMTAVAGDLYDFIEIGPSALGILVVDVMGHGVPAALVASMVKLAFAAQADRAQDPAAVLTGMNQILCRHLDGSYVTAVYAVVDIAERRVTLGNAGHPPALFDGRGGSTPPPKQEHGLVLGFVPQAQYTNTVIEPFAAGDRMLLYSDGVTDARDRAGSFFERDRLARWLAHTGSANADGLADIALDQLTRWTGRQQFDDDVTFVVVEATGQGR